MMVDFVPADDVCIKGDEIEILFPSGMGGVFSVWLLPNEAKQLIVAVEQALAELDNSE